jgi:diguanylate cyclase (GGDEF)-like protein
LLRSQVASGSGSRIRHAQRIADHPPPEPSGAAAKLPRVRAGHHQRHGGLPKPDRAARRASARAARRAVLQAVAIAGATGATVAIAGGGDAFWACVPAALLAAGGARGRVASAICASLVAGAALAAELITTPARGQPSTVLLVLVPAASVAILLAVRDRLERERDTLRASALTDPLTGVANRRSLLARIDYEIARHARTRHTFAVLMLDLDGFKLLNDRFGHPAGDDLLREVAAALARAIRDQDTVARVGGDEFCVLAPETDSAGAQRLIARVEAAVARVVAGVDALGASVGAAVFPSDGTTPDGLLEAADQRLLGAKRLTGTGRGGRRAA